MPVSKTRKKDRPAPKPASVNVSRKLKQVERKRSERAMQVGFTNKWAFLWWILPALGAGFGTQAIYNIMIDSIGMGEQASSREVVLAFLGIVLVQAIPTYFIVLGVARSALTMRSINETIKRFGVGGKWVESLMLSLILPAALVMVLSVSFSNPIELTKWSWLILLASTYSPINNALRYAYKEQYREVTLSPSDRKAEEDAQEEFKKLPLKAKIKARLSVKSFIAPRGKMLMPTVQTMLVWFIPSLTVSIGAILFSPNNDLSQEQFGQISQALAPFSFLALMLTVLIWSKWHLYGGIGRISRVTNGRPLEPIY